MTDEERAREETARLLKESKITESEEAVTAEQPPEPETQLVAAETTEGVDAENKEDDPDYLGPDLSITVESVKETREKMLENIKRYQRSGAVDRDLLVPRKFAKEKPVPKNEEEAKDMAYQKSQKLAAKRAERRARLNKEAQSSAAAAAAEAEEEEFQALKAKGLVGANGKPLTEEEIRAKHFEEQRQKKERAARRRSRSRSESAEKDARLTSPTSAGRDIDGEELDMLGEDIEYDDEATLSPKSLARKPKAQPGCVVHSVGGKFVQVPVFGEGNSSVPGSAKRRSQAAK
jgi:hypothetical protein